MLGAPRCSSSFLLQSEADLVALTTRVEQIVTYCATKVLQRAVEGVARRLRLAIAQGTHSLAHIENWLWIQADLYLSAELSVTQLPASKELCTTKKLR